MPPAGPKLSLAIGLILFTANEICVEPSLCEATSIPHKNSSFAFIMIYEHEYCGKARSKEIRPMFTQS